MEKLALVLKLVIRREVSTESSLASISDRIVDKMDRPVVDGVPQDRDHVGLPGPKHNVRLIS